MTLIFSRMPESISTGVKPKVLRIAYRAHLEEVAVGVFIAGQRAFSYQLGIEQLRDHNVGLLLHVAICVRVTDTKHNRHQTSGRAPRGGPALAVAQRRCVNLRPR